MSGETVPGLAYHGVPVPLDVFRDELWDLREGEYWRRGVEDALAVAPDPVGLEHVLGTVCAVCGGIR